MPDHLAFRLRSTSRHAIALLAIGASVAPAQQGTATGTLHGLVTDSTGRPLPNAEVRIMDENRLTHSDSVGLFALNRLLSGVVEVTVRRLGYRVKVLHVALASGKVDSVRVVLSAEPLLLAPVDIDSRNTEGSNHPFFVEFEKRRSVGVGTFITRDEVLAMNSSYTSDAFRSLPGVHLVRSRGGMGVRFQSSTGMRGHGSGDCTPNIWVDGQREPQVEVDDIRPQDIHGIEIYRGASTTPSQFSTNGAAGCGAIVIWTQRK